MPQSELDEQYAELNIELSRFEAKFATLETRKHMSDVKTIAVSLFESLRGKVQLLETVLENSAESIYAKDRDGRYTYINRVCENEFKMNRELALGRTDFELFRPTEAEEYRSNDLVAMETRKMWEHEVWWNDKIYLTRKVPLISRDGEILGVCGNSVDITDHRRTELALQEAVKALERERENKLMNIEAVLATIAHEIRQPISAIAVNGSAALRFLGKTPPEIEEVGAALHRMIADCQRMSEVFDSIRGLFQRSGQQRHPVNVNDIALEELQRLRGELMERGVTTQTELSSGLPLVEAHKSQLREVISNLVQNAMEAMDSTTGRNKLLTVKTRRDSDAVIVEVQDTGPGIDPRRLSSIFEAFVSSKPHGIGLGLALCRMIVERHGGGLTAVSDGMSGASFKFALPIR
jgi:PAS domain S-box-containing protein